MFKEWGFLVLSLSVVSCSHPDAPQPLASSAPSTLVESAKSGGRPSRDEAGTIAGSYVLQSEYPQVSANLEVKDTGEGTFAIEGYATYETSPGMANTGDVSKTFTIKGNKAVFPPDEDCSLMLRFESGAAVVEGEKGCGGMNVSFNGVYKKVATDSKAVDAASTAPAAPSSNGSDVTGAYVLQSAYPQISASFDIKLVRQGTYAIEGLATYESSPGMANTGDVAKTFTISGNAAVFSKADDDSCSLKLRFEPGGAVIEGEQGCGGMNVSFNGTYKRTEP